MLPRPKRWLAEMSATLTTILVAAAARVGAPLVKTLLEQHVGGIAGEIGGTIIDTIAQNAGVSPAELPQLSDDKLDAAVRTTEDQAPELVAQWNIQQAQAIALQKAEMNKNAATWTWAWRPAWMWFLGFLWGFRAIVVPVVDASVGSDMAMALPLDDLFWLTTVFSGFYMGGHTLKDALAKRLGRPL